MVDITQSYYIYDAIGYQKENVTLQRIDKEMLELDYVEKENPVYCWYRKVKKMKLNIRKTELKSNDEKEIIIFWSY